MGALVLALNPSIDAEWRVETVRWEEKNNVQVERRWAGGKGVNVARWLRLLRGEPRLLLPLGGPSGRELAGYLRGERLPAAIVNLRQPSRVNVIITTADRRQLRFNPLGPELSHSEWQAILGKFRRLLMPASCVVLSGSLPRGVKATTYAQLIGHARRAGVKSILDCDGEAFKEAVAAKPFLVKPNEHELAAWCGNASGAAEALGSAAWKLSGVTGGWVLVSRGAKGGLLINSRLGLEFSARPPCIKPMNTVGAGDAMAAAVARQIELGAAPQEWLRHGIAAGTSATKFPAGILPSFASIEKLAAQIKVV